MRPRFDIYYYAQKYLEEIKSQYPGNKINLQAVFDGQNISLDYNP